MRQLTISSRTSMPSRCSACDVCLCVLHVTFASGCTDWLAVQEQDKKGWNNLEKFRRPLLARIIEALTSTKKKRRVYKEALGAGVCGDVPRPFWTWASAVQPANGASAAAQDNPVTLTVHDANGEPLESFLPAPGTPADLLLPA